jgi:hypothetical protein
MQRKFSSVYLLYVNRHFLDESPRAARSCRPTKTSSGRFKKWSDFKLQMYPPSARIGRSPVQARWPGRRACTIPHRSGPARASGILADWRAFISAMTQSSRNDSRFFRQVIFWTKPTVFWTRPHRGNDTWTSHPENNITTYENRLIASLHRRIFFCDPGRI